MLYEFRFPPIHVICPTHPIVFDLVILIILAKEYNHILKTFQICYILKKKNNSQLMFTKTFETFQIFKIF
jgi:hypothetical protein